MRKYSFIIIICLGLAVLLFLDRWQVTHWQAEKRIELDATLQLFKIRLQHGIQARFYAVESIASLIELHPETTSAEFSQFASLILKIHPPIRALQYADINTRIVYVYPSEGNEITIKEPMNLRDDLKRRPFVEKAIQEKKAILQGPFELRQGGTGLALRFPIFKGIEFLGLSVGIYDISILISEALEGVNLNQFSFSLKDNDGNVFWKSGNIHENSHQKPLSAANTTWIASANWTIQPNPPTFSRLLVWFLGLLLLAAVFIIIRSFMKQSQHLESIVDHRTKELFISNNALKKSTERYDLAMQFVKDGLYDWNLETNEIYYSDGWKLMLGYKPEEIKNDFSEWERLTDPKDVKASWSILNDLLTKKRDRFEMEFKMQHKDGHWVDILSRANVVFDQSGKGIRIVGTHIDTTERKKLEAKLIQAQKMESIGILAGGIAHDFNNILSAILGFTELSLDDVEKKSVLKDDLKEIYAGGIRAKELVKQILMFARQSDQEFSPIMIGLIAKEVLKFLRSSIPTTIEIKSNIQSSSLIMGNSTQVHQIFMNLFTNAAHAMEEKGGTLDVSLNDVVVDKSFEMQDLGLKPGNYIEIKVSDTGCGIPSDIIDKIFEPYFTTKNIGEGTGMGLAIIHGIIKDYGGNITVHSTLGKGSIFIVMIPTTQQEKVHKPYETDKLPCGTENILFVDDEKPIVKMGAKILEKLGYTVSTRTDSVEALELFRQNPKGFDLVITDMTMPTMTGDKLATELIKIKPDIPVILCTGYSKKVSEKKSAYIGISAFANKPIEKKDLARTIRKVLDKAKSAAQG